MQALIFGSPGSGLSETRNFGLMKRPALGQNGPVRQGRLQARAAEREREARLRERENEFIKKIQEQMTRLDDSDMDSELKRLAMQSLEEQIRQIHEARAEREQQAIEREAQRHKAEQEERQREIEDRARALAGRHEDPDESADRAQIRDMSLMGARMDKIGSLQTARAGLKSEAAQLERDAANSRRLADRAAQEVRDGKISSGAIGPDRVVSWQSRSGDFRQGHLSSLNAGIAGIDAAINSQVASLYRDSQRMQERQLEREGGGEEAVRCDYSV